MSLTSNKTWILLDLHPSLQSSPHYPTASANVRDKKKAHHSGLHYGYQDFTIQTWPRQDFKDSLISQIGRRAEKRGILGYC